MRQSKKEARHISIHTAKEEKKRDMSKYFFLPSITYQRVPARKLAAGHVGCRATRACTSPVHEGKMEGKEGGRNVRTSALFQSLSTNPPKQSRIEKERRERRTSFSHPSHSSSMTEQPQKETYHIGAGGAGRVAIDKGLGRVLVARLHHLWWGGRSKEGEMNRVGQTQASNALLPPI